MKASLKKEKTLNRIPVDETNTPVPEEGSEDVFLAFVQEQIANLKKYNRLGSDKELSFDDLNKALCGYQNVNLTLISLYNVAKVELTKEKEKFDDWFAEKFISVRSRENRKELSAQKWASQKEIEMMVRREYSFEYKGWKDSLNVLEHKVAFLRRLLESWNSQQYILSTLSRNLQSEVNALSLSS